VCRWHGLPATTSIYLNRDWFGPIPSMDTMVLKSLHRTAWRFLLNSLRNTRSKFGENCEIHFKNIRKIATNEIVDDKGYSSGQFDCGFVIDCSPCNPYLDTFTEPGELSRTLASLSPLLIGSHHQILPSLGLPGLLERRATLEICGGLTIRRVLPFGKCSRISFTSDQNRIPWNSTHVRLHGVV